MLYRGMDRARLDAAYNNTAAVPERDAIVADWAVRSARVRRERQGHLDLRYGDSPRERLDLFLAADRRESRRTQRHEGHEEKTLFQCFPWSCLRGPSCSS